MKRVLDWLNVNGEGLLMVAAVVAVCVIAVSIAVLAAKA